MSYLGDTLTVGLILVLVFGSIALYLYTRIQQTEQKVSLLESIVLDLKLTGELPVFGEFPIAEEKGAPSAFSLSSSALLPSAPLAPVLTPVAEKPEYAPFPEEAVTEGHVLDGQDGQDGPDGPDGQESTKEGKDSEEGNFLPLEEAVAIHPIPEESLYDHMTLKELQSVMRSRGLPSEKGAKKQALIDALKRSDQGQLGNEIKSVSAPSSSFLESSSPLSEDA